MRRIAFVQQKGGVGKTSLAIHSACALAAQGKKTLLVDLDPQGSIQAWYERADDVPESLSVSRAESADVLDQLSGFTYVLIDTPGRLSGSVLSHCEAVILPIVPSPLDIWAAADSVALIKAAQEEKPQLKAAIVVNRLMPNTILGREVFDVLEGYGLPLITSPIRQRTAYAASLAMGKYAGASGSRAAADEINEFAKNLIKLSK